MPSFEILCVTMHQNDFSKIKEMNISSNAVFANQCDHTSYEELEFDGHVAKMISTETRGVGKNRNLALMYASADICLFADDDVKYIDGVEAKIVSEFEAHPDADIIIFNFDSDDLTRKTVKYEKTKKWRSPRTPWGAIRIAFRLSSIQKANLWFTTLFGGGCIFPSGEDSIWLKSARKAGLTVYVSKETIGQVSFETSSWFTGYDEKFFFAKGVYCQAMHPKTFSILATYFLLKFRNYGTLSFKEKAKWVKLGRRGYREMRGYEKYLK